jgi:hypothetical protein
MSVIFLSYDSADSQFASQLADSLRTFNYRVFEDCIQETSFPLLERLIECGEKIKCLLLIVSVKTSRETVIANDWKDAITDNIIHGRNWIIPVLIQDCELPDRLNISEVEDFRNDLDSREKIERLITRISSL